MIFYLDPKPDLIDYLGQAIVLDSYIVAEHVINQGCNVNEIVPIANLTPFQMSCTKQNGSISLLLLRNGADPQQRSPACAVSSLTLLALRPFGTYRREIVAKLMTQGVTYKTEPMAFKMMYNQAMKRGWYDIAFDILTNSGPEAKKELEDGLLRQILSQNSDAFINALRILFEPPEGYNLPSPMVNTHFTVFHHLALEFKNIRDGNYNQKVARYLISKFPHVELLDKPDTWGYTAIEYAAKTWNHYLITELLRAGADPQKGVHTAIVTAVIRFCYPTLEESCRTSLQRINTKMRRWLE